MTCPNPLDVFPICGGGGGNTSPSFVSGVSSLTVAQGASATDVKGLLHVSDIDAGQTMTWSQGAAPSHGTLSITGATASSGGADITPGGTITYTPAPGYSGTDSFAVAVDDGNMGFATRTINVTISGRTVTVDALSLNSMKGGEVFNQTFTATGGFGAYTYSVSAGDLPRGLRLNTSTGELSGLLANAYDYSYNFTIQATDSSTGTGPFSGTRAFTGTVAGDPMAKEALQDNPPPSSQPGLQNNVTTKKVNSGNGQQMVDCLKDALTEKLSAKAAYEGQNDDGSTRYSIASNPVQTLTFYPVDASTASGAAGITPTEANVLTVTTTCGTFSTVPALFNLKEFAALARSLGMTVIINAEGVITVTSGDTVYVGRPDYLVTTGTPGAPSLKQGEDGLWRFTDSLGNVQILRRAFLRPDVLRQALVEMLGPQFASFAIQTDGSAVMTMRYDSITLKYVLTPSLTLSTAPAEHSADNLWPSDTNKWDYRVYAYPNATQGFTSVKR